MCFGASTWALVLYEAIIGYNFELALELNEDFFADLGLDDVKTVEDLKKTIKEQGSDKRYNDLRIFTGKCERCGCKLTPENYEYKLDFYFPLMKTPWLIYTNFSKFSLI